MGICCVYLSISVLAQLTRSGLSFKLTSSSSTLDTDEIEYMELPVSIEILKPKGIRFVVENATVILQFQFSLNIHKHFNATHLEFGEFNEAVYNYKAKPVLFVENSDCILKKGTKVYYWYAFFDDFPLRYVRRNQSFVVDECEDGKLIAKNTTLDDFPSTTAKKRYMSTKSVHTMTHQHVLENVTGY